MSISPELWGAIGRGVLETLYMTLAAAAFSYVLGLPAGVLLYASDKDGIDPRPWLNRILGFFVNMVRSVPFLILMVLVTPLTRAIAGTSVGSTATIVPLVCGSAPFIARMVESSLKEVDAGVIEAARSMGATNFQLVWKVLLREAKPSLLVGAAISLTTILGYSAMAGFLGGGGLGAIATNYGVYRYRADVMWVTVILLVVIVQVFQEVGMRIAKKADRRVRS